MEATICQISTTPLSTMSQIALSAPILSCKAQQNAKTCATRKRDRETSLATLRTCATTGGSSWHRARPIARTPPAWIAWMTGFTPFTDKPQLDRSRSIGFFKAGRASQSKIRPEGSLSYSDPLRVSDELVTMLPLSESRATAALNSVVSHHASITM